MKNLLAQDLRFFFARLAFSVGRCFAATFAVFFGCLVFRLSVAPAKVRLAGKGRKNIVRDKTPFLKKI